MPLCEQLIPTVAAMAVVQFLATVWLKSRIQSSITHEYNRHLEDFKLGLSLGGEIAKQRVNILGQAWASIATYESALFQHSRRLAEVIMDELRAAGLPNLPASLPEGTAAAIATLGNFGHLDLDEQAHIRVSASLASDRNALRAQADGIVAFLVANRFWLGPEIDSELRTFLTDLTAAFAALSPAKEDMRAFGGKLAILAGRRPDAASMIGRLRPSV